MIFAPWEGKLHIRDANLRELPSPSHGFLISRPMYGTRDAPVRQLMKLSKCLIHMGLRRMKADICTYPKLDAMGNICGFVIVQVGDILYTGASEFLDLVKKTVSQFRAAGWKLRFAKKE